MVNIIYDPAAYCTTQLYFEDVKIPVENLLGSKWSVLKNFVPIEDPFGSGCIEC